MFTGFAATRYYRPAAKFEPGSPLAEHRFEGLPEDPFGEEATEEAREREGAAAEHNLPDDPFGEPATAGNRGAELALLTMRICWLISRTIPPPPPYTHATQTHASA